MPRFMIFTLSSLAIFVLGKLYYAAIQLQLYSYNATVQSVVSLHATSLQLPAITYVGNCAMCGKQQQYWFGLSLCGDPAQQILPLAVVSLSKELCSHCCVVDPARCINWGECKATPRHAMVVIFGRKSRETTGGSYTITSLNVGVLESQKMELKFCIIEMI